jgi:uracil-DNA glycosylase
LNALIDLIASVQMPNVFNPWRDVDDLDVSAANGGGPQSRRNRLLLHFQRSPRFLLIGEAPGYQGCRFSGVPFTSERLLHEGVVPDLRWARFTTRPKPWSEPSATIVWGTLTKLGIAEETVMWNAFPWHPHKPDQPHSNRTPTRNEFVAGADILRKVIRQFPGVAVVAVGQKSWNLLKILDMPANYAVRHPSMGGATDFRNGMFMITGAVNRDKEGAT